MTDRNADAVRIRGQAIRQSRAIRVRTIRRRVIAGAVAFFVATWLLIAVVLATGHDPALSRKTAVASVSSANTSTTTASGDSGSSSGTASTTGSSGSTADDSTSGGSTSGGSTSSGSSSNGATVSSVTTRQS